MLELYTHNIVLWKRKQETAIDIVKNVVTNCRNMGYTKTVVKNDIAHIATIT